MINPRQVRILVVDDEASIRELLAARFSIFGFQSVKAENGEEAWRMISSDPAIKIVITDLTMPGMSGQELLEKCREAHHEYPKLFAITGQPQWPAEVLYALGAEGVLFKPFDARALLNITRTALLKVTERLRYPPYAVPSASIDIQHSSLESAESSGHFAIGRGGIFYSGTATLPGPGQNVGLNIQLGNFHIQGTGVIRWQKFDAQSKMTSAGVEFTYLNNESLLTFEKYLSDRPTKSFIPSPQILSSMPSTAKLQSTG